MCKCIQEDKSDKSVKMTHTNWNKKGDEDEDEINEEEKLLISNNIEKERLKITKWNIK